MPWCENDNCQKRNLKKEDVVFDDLRKQILCIPCAQDMAKDGKGGDVLQGEVIDKTWFGVGFSSDEGVKAELIYRGTKLSVQVTNDQLMRYLGR